MNFTKIHALNANPVIYFDKSQILWFGLLFSDGTLCPQSCERAERRRALAYR